MKLYWAHRDQYYVKTSEVFENYAFRLPDGRTVRFLASRGIDEKDPEADNFKWAVTKLSFAEKYDKSTDFLKNMEENITEKKEGVVNKINSLKDAEENKQSYLKKREEIEKKLKELEPEMEDSKGPLEKRKEFRNKIKGILLFQ